MTTRDELIKSAVKTGLNGGRKFGSEQHRACFQFLADAMLDAAGDNDKPQMSAIVDACVAIGNQSALQQKLDDAGLIDRVKKAEKRANLFADLKA